MKFKLQHGERTYTWIEKGTCAALTVDSTPTTTRMLWTGNPCDPVSLRSLGELKKHGVTLDMLLKLSVMRNSGLAS